MRGNGLKNKVKNAQTLLLYSTQGCHLCELAEALFETLDLSGFSGDLQWDLEVVEVADEPELMQKYGIRIPVVAIVDDSGCRSNNELSWPFDREQLTQFLRSASTQIRSQPERC